MGRYDLPKEALSEALITAAEDVVKAEETLVKVANKEASLADRCNANIQAYVDAMLTGRVGSDHEKWSAAQVEALALKKELGAPAAEAFGKAIRDAIARRRVELDGPAPPPPWYTLKGEARRKGFAAVEIECAASRARREAL